MADKITFTILADGTVRIETEGVSMANHKSAEELLDYINELLGGGYTVRKKERRASMLKHTHTHNH